MSSHADDAARDAARDLARDAEGFSRTGLPDADAVASAFRRWHVAVRAAEERKARRGLIAQARLVAAASVGSVFEPALTRGLARKIEEHDQAEAAYAEALAEAAPLRGARDVPLANPVPNPSLTLRADEPLREQLVEAAASRLLEEIRRGSLTETAGLARALRMLVEWGERHMSGATGIRPHLEAAREILRECGFEPPIRSTETGEDA